MHNSELADAVGMYWHTFAYIYTYILSMILRSMMPFASVQDVCMCMHACTFTYMYMYIDTRT